MLSWESKKINLSTEHPLNVHEICEILGSQIKPCAFEFGW